MTLEDSYASFDIANTVSIYRAEHVSVPDLLGALGKEIPEFDEK